jgi:hypothetical protein
VSDPVVPRVLALLLVAVVAVVAGLAIAGAAGGSDDDDGGVLPTAVPPSGEWFGAIAAPYRVDTSAGLTACGQPARDATLGVAHPVLPCGAKVVLRYGGTEVLTQVIDRGTGRPGREFELTTALAARLGLRGVEPIRWRFAARG